MNDHISVSDLHKLMEEGFGDKAILVDVRSTFEHDNKSIKGAVNYPLDEIETKRDELAEYETVYLYCRSGGRSQAACDQLNNMGLENLVNVEGGILDWEAEGLLVE